MKICPRCGDEFLDRVERCPDCEIELRPEAEMPLLAEWEEGVRLVSGSRRSLQRQSASLRAAGIATRIEEETVELPFDLDGWTYGLYVAPADEERAEEIRRWRGGAKPPPPPPPILAIGRCPACHAEVEEQATECPDCTLSLSGEEEG